MMYRDKPTLMRQVSHAQPQFSSRGCPKSALKSKKRPSCVQRAMGVFLTWSLLSRAGRSISGLRRSAGIAGLIWTRARAQVLNRALMIYDNAPPGVEGVASAEFITQ